MFCVDHGFIRRHIEMQVLLVNTSESTQVSTKRRACTFTGIAVDFVSAIAVIIPRPLVHTMADRGMGWMAPPIALPLIGIELRAARGDVLRNQGRTGAPICMVAHPEALLTRVPRDDADNRGTIVGV